MKYKQGRSFPPTAQGVGLIFILVGGLLFYLKPDEYLFLLLGLPSIWLLFSTTTIDTKNCDQGIIIRRFGLFPLIFSRKIRLKNYDAGVIKLERVKYRTTQSTGVVVINSQDTHDSFMALSLKLKGKYDYEVLFKGSKQEIMSFIQDNLTGTHLRFFNGVLKKEHEIIFDKSSENLNKIDGK